MSSDKPVVLTVPSTSAPDAGGLICTPSGQRDVLIKVLTPVAIIANRAVRVFIQTILGALGTGAGAAYTGVSDFAQAFYLGAGVAASATVICVLQSILELTTQFDQKHPKLAG